MNGIYLLPPALLATLASNPALAIRSSNNDLCKMATSENISFSCHGRICLASIEASPPQVRSHSSMRVVNCTGHNRSAHQ